MKDVFALFIILNLFRPSDAMAAEPRDRIGSCSKALVRSVDGTDHFIAYVLKLLDDGVIDASWVRLLIQEEDELRIPVFHGGDLRAAIHRGGLERFFRESRLTVPEIRRTLAKELELRDIHLSERARTQEETAIAHRRMEFGLVQKGDCVGSWGERIILNRSFFAMKTKVTQGMWVTEMDENPSYFKEGEHTIVFNKNKKQIRLQPDHPIENITWWSALVFANKVSQRMGKPIVYDLSQIEMKGSAADGTLVPAQRNQEGKIKINGPDGDIYRAVGVRLLTSAEMLFMLTDRGRTDPGIGNPGNSYFTGVTSENLVSSAWFNLNSKTEGHPGGTTHPVGLLHPQVLDGIPFWDLHGNVSEFTHDSSPNTALILKGENPLYDKGIMRVLWGGCWGSNENSLRSRNPRVELDNFRSNETGFRLAFTAFTAE